MQGHCPSCGYDLAGLGIDAASRCPECGHALESLSALTTLRAAGRFRRCMVGLAILGLYPLFSILLASMLLVAMHGSGRGTPPGFAGNLVVLGLVTIGVVLPSGIPFTLAAYRSRRRARAPQTAPPHPEPGRRSERVGWTLLALTFALGMGPYMMYVAAVVLW